jgi:protein-disulfide isomerase
MDTAPKKERWLSVQKWIDFVAGITLTAAAVILIWRLAFAAPVAKPPDRPALPLPSEPLSFADAPVDGDRNAPVGILVFSDFQCPFCGRFARETLPTLRSKYVSTGKAFVAFMHFPLETIHPHALEAAVLSECAREQNRFWPLHDALLSVEKPTLDKRELDAAATKVGLDKNLLTQCDVDSARRRIKDRVSAAQGLEVASTPSFMFGRQTSDQKLRVAARLSGALPIARFEAVLNEVLNSK